MSLVNNVGAYLLLLLMSLKEGAIAFMEQKQVRYDAWYVVLLAVLLTLAFTIYAALTIWCVVYKGGAFTGNWEWSLKGVSVRAECK
ncbi:hypothetical protein [Caldalkalibacillus mannanilyticus]|uniref:hypothetical protein n=1 Tax=Caldalkalibacillus mannanilyticus TaxID=1418 RepID=UPI0004687D11|nr:hypothetical protein [Caldalkalibacillus mannanilyticus]